MTIKRLKNQKEIEVRKKIQDFKNKNIGNMNNKDLKKLLIIITEKLGLSKNGRLI